MSLHPEALPAGPVPLSSATREWIAEARLWGLTAADAIEALRAQGVSPEAVRQECARQEGEPAFRAAIAIGRSLRQLEDVLATCHAVRSLAAESRAIQRRSQLSREDFLRQYYAANIPVILTDVARDWPALTCWSLDWLRTCLGAIPVEVMEDRTKSGLAAIDSMDQRVVMPFAEFIAGLEQPHPERELYLVGNNRFMERPEAALLREGYSIDERYLDPGRHLGYACLWLGPAGTVTPLHHDLSNILFCQIRGRKRFSLISPLESHRVYNEVGVFSEVDCENPDLQRFPRFADVTKLDVVLQPGEALFIPVGWWHRVEAMEAGISLSFTNFVFANDFRRANCPTG